MLCLCVPCVEASGGDDLRGVMFFTRWLQIFTIGVENGSPGLYTKPGGFIQIFDFHPENLGK